MKIQLPHSFRNRRFLSLGGRQSLTAFCCLLPMLVVRAFAGDSYVEQIENQRVFASPLEWTGQQEPGESESQKLLADISLFKSDGVKAGFAGLENYLQQYPQSGWAPALNVNLAEYYRKHGRYSLALAHWERAWNAVKDSQQPAAQQLTVRTIAGWTRLLASLGEKDKLNELFKELAGLDLPYGIYGTQIQETKEGLGVMNARPGASYRCGSFALGHMASALNMDATICRGLYETESPDGGFHLDQLLSLARTNGLEVEAVHRPTGTELVVPSVVHWKLNHYAAITEKKGDLYRVEDPTFGGHTWMDADTIASESSGDFLVLKNSVPPSWRILDESECAMIYGKGFPNAMDDSDDDGPPDGCSPDGDSDSDDSDCDPPSANDGASTGGGPPPPNCPDCGMPQWSVSEPYMTLWLKDTPMLYRQSSGKWMKLTLTYKSTGEYLGNYLSAFGPDWSCNWIGMLQADGSDTVNNHLAGGGVAGFNTDGTLNYKTARTLAFTGGTSTGDGGAEMAVRTPTLAQNIYGVSMNLGYDSLTNILLSQRLDRYGRLLKRMDYISGFGIGDLYDVVDMDGKTNMVTDGQLIHSYFVTGVTNPYGASVSFKYKFGSPVLLTNIVDAQGMSTYFMYDSNNRITNMITPYGTNSFQYFSGTDVAGGLERALLITEATGDHQLYVYRDDVDPDAGLPYSGDSFSNLRLSFHWNRSQYQSISSTGKANVFDMTTADYQLASVKHWLHKPASTETVSDTLDSTADPYDPNLGVRPNCISYGYYGQSVSYDIGTLKRITSVSINNQLALTIGRNTLGRPTNYVYYSSYGSLASYTNFFDPSGEILRSERGPRGELTRGYGYDPSITNLLVSVTNAAGDVITYAHEPTTLKVIGITFPGGMVRTNVYYASGPYKGFLQMQADLGFRTNYFTYLNGNLYVQTNELGLVTTNTYDNLNRLISTAYPDGTTVSNVYVKLDIVATKDRLNQWTHYGYNAVRQLMAVTNVNGQITTYDYCGCGSPDQITRWNGATPLVTMLGYDTSGRLTSATYPDHYQLAYAYDAYDHVTNIVDGAGYSLKLEYALWGLEGKITNTTLGGQSLMTRRYDEYGRVTNSVDRNLVTTAMTYDFLDRLTARQNFGTDGNHSGPETFVYNALGLTNYTDPLSHLTTYVRDASGRVWFETNANNELLRFGYNPSDELQILVDGKHQTNIWNYDEYGRVTNKLDATISPVLAYKYDANDRLTNRWSATKGTTIYRYDPIGNLTNVDYSAGSGPVYTPSIFFAYDGVNRLSSMMDGIGTTMFGWTDGDQLASETGPWANDAMSYAYSDRLRTNLSLLQPSASTWIQGYAYDTMMRLSTVTSPAGGNILVPSGNFSYTYTGGGDRVRGLQFPPLGTNFNLYVTNSYDSLARLTTTWVHSQFLGTFDLHSYSYDLGSQVTQQVFTAGNFINYTYDKIGQLKSASGKGPGGLINRLQEQIGYAYDAAWNLNYRTNNTLIQTFGVNSLNELTNTTVNGVIPLIAGSTTSPATNVTVNGVSAVTYSDATFALTNLALTNGLNTLTAVARDTNGRVSSSSIQIKKAGTGSFTYDSNGNLTSDGNRNFAYDVENQLVSVWVANAWSNNFAYDGLMRKRVERDYIWNGSSWPETNEVRYIYDGNLVFQERNGVNVPMTTYTRGNDLSGTLQGAGGIGGLLARSDKMQVIPAIALPGNPNPQYVISSYYHGDGNGNITALVEPNGLPVASYEYDPFGNMIAMSGLFATINHYRFSSKEWNDNAGLYYYGYRFYDPNLQRWANRDPIQETGGLNLYTFLFNNSINTVDLFGQCDIALPKPSTGMGEALDTAGKSLGRGLTGAALSVPEVAATLPFGAIAFASVFISPKNWYETNPNGINAPYPTAESPFAFNASRPIGYWPAPSGAAEWGKRNPEYGSKEGKRRFHKIKQSDSPSKAPDDYWVNPDTGDVADPEGQSVGNLEDSCGK